MLLRTDKNKHVLFLSLNKLWFFTGTSHVLPERLCSTYQRRFRSSIWTTVTLICSPITPKSVIFYQVCRRKEFSLLFSTAVDDSSKNLGTEQCFYFDFIKDFMEFAFGILFMPCLLDLVWIDTWYWSKHRKLDDHGSRNLSFSLISASCVSLTVA